MALAQVYSGTICPSLLVWNIWIGCHTVFPLPFIFNIFRRLVLGLPIFFFLKLSWRLDVVVRATSLLCADVNVARFQLDVLNCTPPSRSVFIFCYYLLGDQGSLRDSQGQSGFLARI